MKAKSWQRFILSLVLVLGYFAAIWYCLKVGENEKGGSKCQLIGSILRVT